MHSNPILSGFNPDPSIVSTPDGYYVATSSFEYLPGLPIYHSKDLENWELVGHVATREDQVQVATRPDARRCLGADASLSGRRVLPDRLQCSSAAAAASCSLPPTPSGPGATALSSRQWTASTPTSPGMRKGPHT